MAPKFVSEKLTEVLVAIQSDSGYTPVAITGSTCPLSDLEGFDSKIWPVAITYLSHAIGVAISNRKNIFVTADGRQRLTIDQIAGEVCKLARRTA